MSISLVEGEVTNVTMLTDGHGNYRFIQSSLFNMFARQGVPLAELWDHCLTKEHATEMLNRFDKEPKV